MDKIIIGEISKAQGVRGEVKVNPLTDDLERFYDLEEVIVSGNKLVVEYAKVLCNGVFVKLKGIDDRNHAELLVGKRIEVERKNAVKLKEGEYFIVDVIGSRVTLDGEELGQLVDIMQYGSADVYVVKLPSGKSVMFPLLKDAINSINTDTKIIDLKRSRFEEIAVYED